METFLNLLSLLGSLGLFLFGMKTMSEGLEKSGTDDITQHSGVSPMY